MSQLFTSLDHQDILDSLVLYMRNQEEFKDFDFDGSAIRELLRVLAYNDQNQAFQNNFLYNELQHDSAQLRQNLTSLTSRVGYTPTSKRAAKMKVHLTVVPADVETAASTLILNRDVSFYATSDGAAFVFSPDAEYTANLVGGAYLFSNVTLLQGTWAINAFFVQTDKGFESYVIPNTDIDTTTLEVFVRTSETSGDQIEYTEFKTAYDLGATSKIFFLRENRNGFYEFKFGDNKFADKLNYGNVITTRYLVTQGESGNNLSNLVPSTSIGGHFNITINKVDLKSYAGSEVEDIESIRTLAPLNFSESDSAVTPSGYIGITRRIFTETGDVIAWGGEDNDPPKYGYSFLCVKPKNSETLSTNQKADLILLLKQYNVGSITPVIVDPTYTYINVTSTVKYNPKVATLSTESLKAKVSDYCREYSKQKLEKFRGELDMSRFPEFINSIDKCITGNYTNISYEKRLVPTLNYSGGYTIKFNHIIEEGSVLVENFRVADVDDGAIY